MKTDVYEVDHQSNNLENNLWLTRALGINSTFSSTRDFELNLCYPEYTKEAGATINFEINYFDRETIIPSLQA